MKKFLFLLLVMSICFAAGCSDTQKPDETSQNVTTDIQQQKPDATQADGQTGAELKTSDAYQLVCEKVDKDKYSITEISEKDIDDKSISDEYYVFSIALNKEHIGDVAVNKSSGDLMCFENGKIESYDKFALYDPLQDAICQWDGVYKCAETGYSLALYQGDSNSFEFYIEGDNLITGIGKIKGNTATCAKQNVEDESKVITQDIKFVCSQPGVFEISGDSVIAGIYK